MQSRRLVVTESGLGVRYKTRVYLVRFRVEADIQDSPDGREVNGLSGGIRDAVGFEKSFEGISQNAVKTIVHFYKVRE